MTVNGTRIHVVWPTLVPGTTTDGEPTLALFYAVSQDGRRFTARQSIPTDGVPRHPRITPGQHGDVVIVWDEQSGGRRRIALARATAEADGNARFVRQAIADDASAAYPIVARTDDATVVAWTSGPTGQTVLRVQRVSP